MSWDLKEQTSPEAFYGRFWHLPGSCGPLAGGHGPAATAGTGPGAAVAVAKALRGRRNGAKGKGNNVS